MSRTYNTVAKQGERWFRGITIMEDDEITPVDISGRIGKMQIRESYSDDLVAEAVVSVDGPNGVVTMEVPSTVTAEMLPRRYFYDLFLDDLPFLEGAFEIQGSMTKLVEDEE